ncbi:hypothetical protein J0A68_12925 [Algoriphagus sp. H41]|uniref:Uncharacterized protein n=1 Tax=Algoriphagus oliviformis TaxID=2811231 RepID=A0ABS3C8C7_9BACT|nr:hypothetical protein [Algoriphagus oliviformis]MBN7811854.1 hypothetical protein [Algoriphagus oliviformis]
MAKNTFLEYYKTILEKVSFDGGLVAKEYRKAKELLQESEQRELDQWLKSTGLVSYLRPVTPQMHQGSRSEKRPSQPLPQSTTSPKALA